MRNRVLSALLFLILSICVLPMLVLADEECTHANQTHYEAKQANCCASGYETYSQCNDCHALFDGSGNSIGSIPYTTDPNNHTHINDVGATEGNCCFPGTDAHKKCGGCGQLFDENDSPISNVQQTATNPNNHTSIGEVAATDSTCCTNGNITYYRCGGCGALFRNADGSNPITLAETKLPIDEDNHSNYVSDILAVDATCCTTGTKAHKKCGGCGKLFDMEGNSISAPETIPIDPDNHSTYIAGVPAVDATCCTTGNNAYFRCGGCSRLFQNEAGTEPLDAVPQTDINADNHSNIVVTDELPATCCNTGIAQHKKCTGCGKLFDMAGTPVASVEKLPVNANNHSQLNPVAENPANCAVGGVAAHYKCGGCGRLFEDDKGEKSLEAVPKTEPNPDKHAILNPVAEDPANCAVGGVAAHYKCGGCGRLFEDDKGEKSLEAAPKTAPDPTKHTKLNFVEGNPATCVATGVKEHYKCGGCGKLFADEDGLNPLSVPEVLPVDEKAHSWNSGVVTRLSTCSTKGNKRFTCTRDSGHYYDQELSVVPTAHDWDEGKITTEPTCYQEGVRTFTCKNNSSHTYTEKVSATGKHNHSILSCDSKYHTYICSTPGCTSSVSEKHDFGIWKIWREATKEYYGLLYKSCKECGYKIFKRYYFSTNPKTGDVMTLAAATLILSSGGLTAATIYKKKKK